MKLSALGTKSTLALNKCSGCNIVPNEIVFFVRFKFYRISNNKLFRRRTDGKNMNATTFCLYTYRIFWKKEKLLSFFYNVNLILFFVTMLIFWGDIPRKCSLIYCIKGGMYGVLCLSILIGFFMVWGQSLEERKEDFIILRRLGIRKRLLVLTLQWEMLLFQIISSIGAILLMVILSFFIGEYEVRILIAAGIRINLELQLISPLITWGFISKKVIG